MNTIIFGHRGAAGEAPENTMTGFHYAWEQAGVRSFELDVHLTKDEDLAILHDATLDRTTNGTGYVGDYTMDELRSFDARSIFKETSAPASIPSLDEFLDEFAGRLDNLQLEIKTDTPIVLDEVVRRVLTLLKVYDIREKTVVTSFDTYPLKRVRQLSPSQRCGLIAMHYSEQDLANALSIGCWNTCIPLHNPGSKELIRKAREAGLQTTGWLGNTIEEVDTLLSWGVDSITTNFPTQIIAYMKSLHTTE